MKKKITPASNMDSIIPSLGAEDSRSAGPAAVIVGDAVSNRYREV
jgi:hypothetical protein